jgi:cyclohexyl-isocyanide hydratase
MSNPVHIGFLIYPDVTQLDATGPAQILSMVPGAIIHMIWKNLDPVASDAGFSILPTDTFDTCPDLDVVCVPGGMGQMRLMRDQEVLGFLKRQGEQARYVTSVCSGSLLLGAAGLMQGYKAACHWAFREMLPEFGAEPVAERIVRDRNRISGGGVTAGIDFGLALAAELADEDTAKIIQLFVEYDPHPPFDAGTPEKAGPELEAKVRAYFESAGKTI